MNSAAQKPLRSARRKRGALQGVKCLVAVIQASGVSHGAWPQIKMQEHKTARMTPECGCSEEMAQIHRPGLATCTGINGANDHADSYPKTRTAALPRGPKVGGTRDRRKAAHKMKDAPAVTD